MDTVDAHTRTWPLPSALRPRPPLLLYVCDLLFMFVRVAISFSSSSRRVGAVHARALPFRPLPSTAIFVLSFIGWAALLAVLVFRCGAVDLSALHVCVCAVAR